MEESVDPNEVILESLTRPKNVNHCVPPNYKQSEQTMTKKYTELLDQFFQSHQPSFIFEPLRKEYYWTNEPFDEEKVTRLDKSADLLGAIDDLTDDQRVSGCCIAPRSSSKACSGTYAFS